ncbi:MAG: hypothetical protein GQF41_0368 [Candidatus Rifleibacterium amylolyticum]|jgi:hypothetical protein|nr:MAG: hypothetical protein GQF41_0368 [Candidatus Rifleibacterium amylolyticum]
MQESNDATRFLIVLLVVTLMTGALVLVVKSDFRIRDNVLSNLDYYPHIKIDKGQD